MGQLLCDFAALNKYMRAKPNVTVTSYTSVDPILPTDIYKTLVFGRDDMGRARDNDLRRGEQVPGAMVGGSLVGGSAWKVCWQGFGGMSFSGGRTLNCGGAKLYWLVGDGSAAGS